MANINLGLLSSGGYCSNPSGGYGDGSQFSGYFDRRLEKVFDGIEHRKVSANGYEWSSKLATSLEPAIIFRHFLRSRKINKISVTASRYDANDDSPVTDGEGGYGGYSPNHATIVEYLGEDDAWHTVGSVSSNDLIRNSFTCDITAKAVRVTVTDGAIGGFALITDIGIFGDEDDPLNVLDSDPGVFPLLQAYGNSTTYATTWVAKLNALMAVAYLYLEMQNLGYDGSLVGDLPGASGYPSSYQYPIMRDAIVPFWEGHNDVRYYDFNNADQVLDWKEMARSVVTWLSVPTAAMKCTKRNFYSGKIVSEAADSLEAGTWTDAPYQYAGVYGTGRTTDEVDATQTFTVNGTAIVIGLHGYKSTMGAGYEGVGEIFIDGVSRGTFNTLFLTDTGATYHGNDFDPKGIIVTGLSDDEHEVVIKNTVDGEAIFVDWVAAIDEISTHTNYLIPANLNYQTAGSPWVGAHYSDANVDRFNADLEAVLDELRDLGLPILDTIDLNSQIDPDTDLADGLHQSADGGDPKVAAAFWEVIQPLLPQTPDFTSPSVEITAPVEGTTVEGVIPFEATCADNVAVVGVQLLLDGDNYGSEVTGDDLTSVGDEINTALLDNGAHTVGATVRDAAGNETSATEINFTIDNPAIPPVVINADDKMILTQIKSYGRGMRLGNYDLEFGFLNNVSESASVSFSLNLLWQASRALIVENGSVTEVPCAMDAGSAVLGEMGDFTTGLVLLLGYQGY